MHNLFLTTVTSEIDKFHFFSNKQKSIKVNIMKN